MQRFGRRKPRVSAPCKFLASRGPIASLRRQRRPGKGHGARESDMGRQPSAKPTSFDIAYLARVSQPTVSRARPRSTSASAATRTKIQRIERAPNYTGDKTAPHLPSQPHHTTALTFFHATPPPNSITNPPT